MKKFLSIILALCMIMALVPSVFAEDTATDTQEPSGIRIFYDVGDFSVTVGESSYNEPVRKTTYDNTNEFYAYYDGNFDKDRTDKRLVRLRGTVEDGNANLQLTSNIAVVYEVYIPVAGTYTMKMNNGIYNDDNTLPVEVYLSTAAEIEKNGGVYKSTNSGDKDAIAGSLGEYIGSYSCVEDGVTGTFTKLVERTIPGFNIPEAGYYTIAFYERGSNGSVGNFCLTSGSTGDTIPMTMATGIDTATLKIGENEKATMTAKAYMSDGEEAENYTVSYTSSDENVATVDENGLVTAKAYGVKTVTITASATIDGYTVTNSEEITVNADGISIAYNVGTDSTAVTSTEPYAYLTTPSYITTDGFYDFYDTNEDTSTSGNYIRKREKSLQLSSNRAVVYEVYIPVAGNYTMEMYNSVYSAAASANVYLSTAEILKENGGVYNSTNSGYAEQIKASLGTYIGKYDCSKDGTSTVSGTFSKLVTEPNTITGFEIPEAGNYTIAFYADGGNVSVGDFTLTNGTGLIVPMSAPLTISDDTASVAETVVMSDGNEAALDDTFTVTYTSSDKSVATVDANGKITKLSNGTTEITATVAKNGGVAMSSVTYEVTDMTPAVETVSANVSFSATTNVSGYSVEVTGIDYNNAVDSIERGESVTVTAPEIPNYKFVGWKRGSGENGAYINKPQSFTFTLVTNTFLTAMYDEIADSGESEPIVEYYNENGDYIATQSASVAAPAVPSLVGYTFSEGEWYVAEDEKLDLTALTEAVTRAVAKHTANKLDAVVTVDGEPVSDVVFNKKVVAEDSNATCWKRDGEIVAYGTEYTYYIWGATAITPSYEEITEKAPRIILEGDDGAYMIEYDAGDKTIVEAGILFGSETPSVSSCTKKYTSQRDVSHGQFTASGEGTARGYIIYRDGEDYVVKYSN